MGGLYREQVAAALPAGASLGFYRTAVGAEIDLVVETGRRRIGIQVKFASAAKPGARVLAGGAGSATRLRCRRGAGGASVSVVQRGPGGAGA